MNELPNELKQLLLSNLPFEDLINLSKVNKQFNQALKFKLIPSDLPHESDNYLKALVQTYYKEMTQFAFQFPEKSDKIRNLFITYLTDEDIQLSDSDNTFTEDNYISWIAQALITKNIETTSTPTIPQHILTQLNIQENHPFYQNYHFINYIKRNKYESNVRHWKNESSAIGNEIHKLKGIYINLSGANLRNIVIARTDSLFDSFTEIDMTNINLTHVNLKNAYLPCCNLNNANLSHANLSGTIFHSQSYIKGTSTMLNANFSNAVLLEDNSIVQLQNMSQICIQNRILKMTRTGEKVTTTYNNISDMTHEEYINEIIPELIRIRVAYFKLWEKEKSDSIEELISSIVENLDNNKSFYESYNSWYKKYQSVIENKQGIFAKAKTASNFNEFFFTQPKDELLESLKALEANAKQHAELLKKHPPKSDDNTGEIRKNASI